MVGAQLNLSRLLEWRPEFISEVSELAESTDPPSMVSQLLTRDNITVNPSGQYEELANHEGGILFVGEHKQQFEFLPLMAVLHDLGRTGLKNIVKPYVGINAEKVFGPVGLMVALPVYPRALDRDRPNIWNDQLRARMLFRRYLQTAANARRLTDISLQMAADELVAGEVINIFPCGRVVDSMKNPWREGVGRIIGLVPEEKGDDVLVVPYHANNIKKVRMAAALAARGKNILGRPQTVEVVFGPSYTVNELIDALPPEHQANPRAMTDLLREMYADSFAR